MVRTPVTLKSRKAKSLASASVMFCPEAERSPLKSFSTLFSVIAPVGTVVPSVKTRSSVSPNTVILDNWVIRESASIARLPRKRSPTPAYPR